MAIVDLPALEFVQQRLVADIQTSRRLLAIPTGLFEDSKNQLFLRVLGCARCDVLQRHIVFFWLRRRGRPVGLLILEFG